MKKTIVLTLLAASFTTQAEVMTQKLCVDTNKGLQQTLVPQLPIGGPLNSLVGVMALWDGHKCVMTYTNVIHTAATANQFGVSIGQFEQYANSQEYKDWQLQQIKNSNIASNFSSNISNFKVQVINRFDMGNIKTQYYTVLER
ncbi:hypothetical protein [Vibrio sp. SCSIO 43136]|uniref:hypothetical protein n=1 Tax=Vibrio sp. SCSIO 43136 TaxID=2819101 RepID=UPI0020751BFA|nr:hypothetical protein [Vibrio sp. SCSIO 43136]USD67373.1 hypothetical protein J4N39_22350 [Vibrio sp. SCSIO 43136]